MKFTKLINSIKEDLDAVKAKVQSIGETTESTARNIVGNTVADGAIDQINHLKGLAGATVVATGAEVLMKAATKRVAVGAGLGAATMPVFVPALVVATVGIAGYVAYKALQVSGEDE